MPNQSGQCRSYISDVTLEEPEENVRDSRNVMGQTPETAARKAHIGTAARSAAPIHLRVEVFMRVDDA